MAKKKAPKRGRPVTTGKTPIRSLRVSDDVWTTWQERAEKAGKTLSEWLREKAEK